MGGAREIGPEPWEDSLLSLPRETFGYIPNPREMMMMLSQIAATGFWSHFIHPDDVFDIPEDGKNITYVRNKNHRNWRGVNADGSESLLSELDNWIGTVKSLFPWLEFLTTAQAADRFRIISQSQNQISISRKKIEIQSPLSGLYYVRTDKSIKLKPESSGQVLDAKFVFNGILHIIRSPPGKGVFLIQDA